MHRQAAQTSKLLMSNHNRKQRFHTWLLHNGNPPPVIEFSTTSITIISLYICTGTEVHRSYSKSNNNNYTFTPYKITQHQEAAFDVFRALHLDFGFWILDFGFRTAYLLINMNIPPEAVDDDDVNKSMDFKDTELTLGLPGRPRRCSSSAADHFFGGIKSSSCSMKRGFMETVDQNIGLESSTNCGPRSQIKVDGKLEAHYNNYSSSSSSGRITTAVKFLAAKARVVGWPPVRSLRQKALVESKSTYVKVGADGAPYLRKLDLDMYKSYHELLRALDQMFPSFTTRGKYAEDTTSNQQLMKPAVKGMDEYIVVTYEDKDGDWMLVGDVPWKLFIESCKRIRLMKSSEAVGIAPRTFQVLTQ